MRNIEHCSPMLCVGVVDWSRKELESFRVVEKLEIEPKKFIQLRCAGATRASGGQIDLARSVVYPPLGVQCTLCSECSVPSARSAVVHLARY